MLFGNIVLTGLYAGSGLASPFRPVKRAINKPAVSDGLGAFSNSLVNKYMTNTSYSISTYPLDVIDSRCAGWADLFNVNQSYIITYNVTYPGCSTPWRFCRHVNATISPDDMAKVWSRVPIRMRSAIASIIYFSDADRGAYYGATVDAEQAYWGAWTAPGVYLHETFHSLDAYNAFQVQDISNSAEWKAAINNDTHVVTNYAKDNYQEDLAETGVVSTYDFFLPGGVYAVQSNYTLAGKQISFLKEQARLGTSRGRDLMNNTAGIKCTARPALGNIQAKTYTKAKRTVEMTTFTSVITKNWFIGQE